MAAGGVPAGVPAGFPPVGAGLLAPGAHASVDRASTRASTAPSSSLSMIDSIPAIGLGESIPSLHELSATLSAKLHRP